MSFFSADRGSYAAITAKMFPPNGRMTRLPIQYWVWVHKWTSLVCTIFLLLVCLSGLPLIFKDEIDHWLNDDPPFKELPAETPAADLDQLVTASRALYPGEIVVSIFIDPDEPKVVVSMARSWSEVNANFNAQHWIRFDSRTGEVLKQLRPIRDQTFGFTGLMLNLHRDLFMRLPGELIMGLMAILFVIAILSGLVLYSPFMRRLEFGAVRWNRSARLRWLDLHNLLGVTTAAWALVVGMTGAINEFQTPLFALWQRTEVAGLLKSSTDLSLPSAPALTSVQAAYKTVTASFPTMIPTSVIFPGAFFGTPYHYLFWTKGRTALTSRLFSPILIDARTGKLDGAVAMPWYLRALEISRPLHFGDYGGLFLKCVWVVLDLITIIVLASGLYLWISRRSAKGTENPSRQDGLWDLVE